MIDLKSKIIPTFCPGCHNFPLYAAIQMAINQLNIPKENIVMVFDIGCIGNMADFFSTYGVHSLHGRCIPVAMGVKLANPNLTVFAIGGDGGVYGEGFNHLITASRLNADITAIIANNYMYSLTTGQASPTSPQGTKSKSTPTGSLGVALDPVAILKAIDSQIDAKSVDGTKLPEMVEAIKIAVNTPKFSLIDFSQSCATFARHVNS